MLPENLASLHSEEERIRQQSIDTLLHTADLTDHLGVVHASMAVIYALSHDHEHTSEDQLTVQYLGLRLFNSSASSVKLAFSGYFQSAFSLLRDIFETSALIDYFKSNPDMISDWKSSDKKDRVKMFGPGAIRNALNKRDGFKENKRKQAYDQLSEYATHATAPGFRLLAPEGLGRIGPFFEEKYLRAYLEEAAKRLTHAGVIFGAHFKDMNAPLLLEKMHFLKQVEEWHSRYLRLEGGTKAT